MFMYELETCDNKIIKIVFCFTFTSTLRIWKVLGTTWYVTDISKEKMVALLKLLEKTMKV